VVAVDRHRDVLHRTEKLAMKNELQPTRLWQEDGSFAELELQWIREAERFILELAPGFGVFRIALEEVRIRLVQVDDGLLQAVARNLLEEWEMQLCFRNLLDLVDLGQAAWVGASALELLLLQKEVIDKPTGSDGSAEQAFLLLVWIDPVLVAQLLLHIVDINAFRFRSQ
jgi:hypothetical protein